MAHRFDYVCGVDRQEAATLITGCGYYGTVTSAELTGTEIYGMRDDEGALVACVVIVRAGAQAYLDYLCTGLVVRGKKLSAVLLNEVRRELEQQKVLVVHTCVSGENNVAMRLLMVHHAMIGWPYVNGVIKLEG